MPKYNPDEDVPGFPDYSITKDGQIWSKPRISAQKHKIGGQWLKPRSRVGYLAVELYINSRSYTCNIHRLVLETFIGPCPEGMECRHLNGNKQDNRLENLKWGTHSKNQYDAVQHQTHVDNRGEKHGLAKLTEQDVRMIIYMYRTGLFLQREIAEIYNVFQNTISRIITGKRWRHLYAKV